MSPTDSTSVPPALDNTRDSAAPPERLLVVDDEEVNRDVLSRRLRRAGYEVECANDGPEALAKVREKSYDMLLVDIMMPGMTGMEVLKEIRAKFSASELPVIIVSALNESNQIVLHSR